MSASSPADQVSGGGSSFAAGGRRAGCVWGGVPAGCQWPKWRNRVGFDEPAGRTWRGVAAERAPAPVGASLGKKGDDQLRVAPPVLGAAVGGPASWRIVVIGAVKMRSVGPPSAGHAASRPASLIARDTSNSIPQTRQQNA
jgi:hypothetical protein